MAKDPELQDAINKAAVEISGKPLEELTSGAASEAVEEVVEETGGGDEESSGNEDVDEVIADSDLTDAQKDEAMRLYRALNNPKQAPALVAALAQNQGLLTNLGDKTKTEVKEVKKDILAIFEEELGPQMKFLAPQLSKAVDRALAQEREEQQEAVGQLQLQNTLKEVNDVLATLAKETNGSSKQFEDRMASLMETYPKGPDTSIDKYIRDMYTLASVGKVKQTVNKQVADKIRRNANNASERLGNKGGTPNTTDSLPAKKMNLTESVKWAADQLASQGGKKAK